MLSTNMENSQVGITHIAKSCNVVYYAYRAKKQQVMFLSRQTLQIVDISFANNFKRS